MGDPIQKATSFHEYSDVKKLKTTLTSSYEGLDIEAVGDRLIDILMGKKFTAYYDDAMQCMAIIIPQGQNQRMATLISLSTKSSWLNNVMRNAFTTIKKNHPVLAWTVSEQDENLTWFFEKADGSFLKDARVLFYCGCDRGSCSCV